MGQFKGLLILLPSALSVLAQTNPPVPVRAAAPAGPLHCIVAVAFNGQQIGSADSSEQERLIEAARQVALGYAKSLPNFLRAQTIRRFLGGKYRDTLTEAASNSRLEAAGLDDAYPFGFSGLQRAGQYPLRTRVPPCNLDGSIRHEPRRKASRLPRL